MDLTGRLSSEAEAGWQLSPLERQVRDGFEVRRTLATLYKVLQGSYFRFLEAAFQLTVARVLEIGEVGEAESLESSQELGVYDLLLEQAAEDDKLLLRPKISLELLERFYPVWLRRPVSTAEDPPPIAELRRRIDGKTPIRELLAEDASNAELLAVELRQGGLALLPCPISELEGVNAVQEQQRWWRV